MRLLRILALIPRSGQLHDRPFQFFRDRLKPQRDQHLDGFDPGIQALYQLLSRRVHRTDLNRPFDSILPCC